MIDKFLDLDLDTIKATAQNKLMGSIQNKLEAANIDQVMAPLKGNPTTTKALDPFFAALNKVGADICSVTGTCPFSKPEISIVPVRYAIDEQLSDSTATFSSENSSPSAHSKTPPKLPGASSTPKGKHPLPTDGLWQPPFHTGVRQPQLSVQAPYTLRQLRDGWLYVYSGQDDTLHEYKVEGTSFIKIEWSDSDVGKDERGTEGSAAGYLSYPSNQVLQLAFAHQRWTWRLCEHMRSNHGSRTSWMRKLSLPDLAAGKKVMHCADIAQLGILTADINATASTRFSQTCTPLFQADIAEEKDDTQPPLAKKHADTVKLIAAKPSVDADAYTQDIPHIESAVMVALGDPLADLCDLYQLLAPEWAELNKMQESHDLHMAAITEQLALPQIDEEQLPKNLHDDMPQRVKFKRLVMELVTSREIYRQESGKMGSMGFPHGSHSSPSVHAIEKELNDLGYVPTDAQLDNWIELQNYQNEVDWQRMDRYVTLYQNQCQRTHLRHQDLRNACEQLDSNPICLGLDSQQVLGQGYLQTLFVELMQLLKLTSLTQEQNKELFRLLSSEKPDNLLTIAPYGFDVSVYQAMTDEILGNDTLKQLDSYDIQTWITRLSEWDAIRSDSNLRDSVWYRKLVTPVRRVLNAVQNVGSDNLIKLQGIIQSAVPNNNLINKDLLTGLRFFLMLSTTNTTLDLKFNIEFQNQQKIYLEGMIEAERKLAEWKSKKSKFNKKIYAEELERLKFKLTTMQYDDYPSLIKFGEALLEDKTKAAFSKHIKDARNKIINSPRNVQQRLNSIVPNLGSVGGALAMINTWNLGLTIINHAQTEAKNGSTYALREMGISFSWTANTYASLYQASVWSDIAKNHNQLLQNSLSKAYLDNKVVVKSFIRNMGTMAGFGLVAASLDSWRSFAKISNLNSDLTDTERKLYEIQGYINGAQAFISFYQIMALVAKASMGAIFAPWMLIATATIGVSLVIVDVIINKFKKSALEKWLKGSTWGVEREYWSIETELNKLDFQLKKPRASTHKTKSSELELKLTLPSYLENKKVGLKVVTNRMQSQISISRNKNRKATQDITSGIIEIKITHISYTLLLKEYWHNSAPPPHMEVLIEYPNQYGEGTNLLRYKGLPKSDLDMEKTLNPEPLEKIAITN